MDSILKNWLAVFVLGAIVAFSSVSSFERNENGQIFLRNANELGPLEFSRSAERYDSAIRGLRERKLVEIDLNRTLQKESFGSGLQVLVTLAKGPSAELLAKVCQVANSQISGYIPHETYLMYLPDHQNVEKLLSLPPEEVVYIHHMRPEYKYSLSGLTKAMKDWQSESGKTIFKKFSADQQLFWRPGHIPLKVLLVPGLGIEVTRGLGRRWRDLQADRGIRILTQGSDVILVETPTTQLHETLDWVAHHEEVSSIGLVSAATGRNAGAQWVTQSGDVDVGTSVWAKGIDGTGQLVGVSDTGFDMTNCLLSNRFEEDGFGGLEVCSECTLENFMSLEAIGADGVAYYSVDDPLLPEDPMYLEYCEWTLPECTAVDPQARKVAGYYGFVKGDAQDSDGHGTHCAGSAGGHASEEELPVDGPEINRYQGMAPGSKLVLVDLASSDVNDGDMAGILPTNETLPFFWEHGMGARLHSASWGLGWALTHWEGYNAAVASFDRFVTDHPEDLVVVAAANDGDRWGYGSLMFEAQAKNILTVGATRTPSSQVPAFSEIEVYDTLSDVINNFCPPNGELMSDDLYDAVVANLENCRDDDYQYSDELWEYYTFARCAMQGPLLQSTDPDLTESKEKLAEYLCGEYLDQEEPTGAIFQRPQAFTCSPPSVCDCLDIDDSCANPDEDFHSWCWTDPNCPFDEMDWTYCNLYELPDGECEHALCEGDLGMAILSVVQMNLCEPGIDDCACHPAVEERFRRTVDLTSDGSSVAVFSSRGPTWDGRIKPDVLAPGWTISAASGGSSDNYWDELHCDPQESLTISYGTSMATPVAAGAAALVRQYFTDGFHICGVSDPENGHLPSAALLKATLINSARPPTSNFTLAEPDVNHGDCQQSWVDYSSDTGVDTPDELCRSYYGNDQATCIDLSPLFTQVDGESIFCNFDGPATEGGCVHVLECCLCNQADRDVEITPETDISTLGLCDEYACVDEGVHYRRRRLLSESTTQQEKTQRRNKESEAAGSGKEHEEAGVEGEHVQLGSDSRHVMIYGHGQVQLSNVLMFQGEDVVMHFVDNVMVTNAGEVFEYNVTVDNMYERVDNTSENSGWFRVVLVWTDPPALPTTAHGRSLVNDLDLEVEHESVLVLGNEHYNLPSEVLDENGHDRVNNVEVVHLDNPQAGTFVVRVRASKVPMPSQAFALVVTYRASVVVSCSEGEGNQMTPSPTASSSEVVTNSPTIIPSDSAGGISSAPTAIISTTPNGAMPLRVGAIGTVVTVGMILQFVWLR